MRNYVCKVNTLSRVQPETAYQELLKSNSRQQSQIQSIPNDKHKGVLVEEQKKSQLKCMICPKFVIIAIIPRASSLIYVKISNTTTQSTFNRCRPLHMYSWELYKLHPSLGHRRPVECKQMREAGSYNVDASLQALHSSKSFNHHSATRSGSKSPT